MPRHSRMLGRNDKEANVKQSFAKEENLGCCYFDSLYSKMELPAARKPQRYLHKWRAISL